MADKKKFKKLKVGDKFSMSENVDDKYLNIVIKPSIHVTDTVSISTPFNVIALENGRPRTFHSDEYVYLVQDKEN